MLHQQLYNWNIVESGIEHNNPGHSTHFQVGGGIPQNQYAKQNLGENAIRQAICPVLEGCRMPWNTAYISWC